MFSKSLLKVIIFNGGIELHRVEEILTHVYSCISIVQSKYRPLCIQPCLTVRPYGL